MTALSMAVARSGRGDWLTNHSTLAVGVVGIVVSGILGPAITVGLARKNARQEFKRDLIVSRRTDLGHLLDEAAVVLAVGATNLRLIDEANRQRSPTPDAVSEWARSIFPLGQRLRLRLPERHRVVLAYDDVRQKLETVQAAIAADLSTDDAIEDYEASRSAFLDAARDAVQGPVDEGQEI